MYGRTGTVKYIKTNSWRNIYFFDAQNTAINSISGSAINTASLYTFVVPNNTVKIGFEHFHDGYDGISEIYPTVLLTKSATPSLFSSFFAVPATTSTEKVFTAAPEITVGNSNVWSTSKDVSISYPTGYTNEYSLDGENWQAYTTSIKVTEPTTIFARTMNGEEVISSSSYQITKIDNTKPTISLDGVPTSIDLGSDYSLPTSYTADNTKSGGKAVCTINGTTYTSTSTLPLGKYDVSCTVTTGAGVMASVTKSVEVTQIKQIIETTPAPIDSTTTTTTTTTTTAPANTTSDTTTIKGDETNATTN